MWPNGMSGLGLSPMLKGKTLEIYNKLLPEESLNYDGVKVTLLVRFDFTERRYQKKFPESEPNDHENPSQFMFRLNKYFAKWVELAKVSKPVVAWLTCLDVSNLVISV